MHVFVFCRETPSPHHLIMLSVGTATCNAGQPNNKSATDDCNRTPPKCNNASKAALCQCKVRSSGRKPSMPWEGGCRRRKPIVEPLHPCHHRAQVADLCLQGCELCLHCRQGCELCLQVYDLCHQGCDFVSKCRQLILAIHQPPLVVHRQCVPHGQLEQTRKGDAGSQGPLWARCRKLLSRNGYGCKA